MDLVDCLADNRAMESNDPEEVLVRSTLRRLRDANDNKVRSEILAQIKKQSVQAFLQVEELIQLDPTLISDSIPATKWEESDATFVGDSQGSALSNMRLPLSEMPSQLGEFRIVRQLGTGGMGIVYEAEQERPKRRVALKVMRADLLSADLQQRFQFETEILGRLDHPGIARIYASGWEETPLGRQPWFAMELIDGQTILQFAQEESLNPTDLIVLFVELAAAVHGAHQKGVIHRDLKPANILIDQSGRVKVLDFGLARLADRAVNALHTQTGQLVGTLNYMSPEQARGSQDTVDLRTDVYSLGCILYELLGGVVPIDTRGMSLTQSLESIQRSLPKPLGSFDSAFRGDLELIVAKSIDKDKERRYGSAAAFSDDLKRFLAKEPIAARAPSTWYQVKKMAQRHQAAFLATVLVFVAVVIGAVVSFNFALEAQEQAKIAEREGSRAEREAAARVRMAETAKNSAEVARRQSERAEKEAQKRLKESERSSRYSRFLIDTFAKLDPSIAMGEEISLRAAMREVEEKFSKALVGDPESRVHLHGFFAQMSQTVGDYSRGKEHARAAVELLKKFPDYFKLASQVHLTWAWCSYRLGELADANKHLKRAEEILAAHGVKESRSVARIAATRAEFLQRQSRFEEALQQATVALDLRKKILDPNDDDIALSYFIRGSIYVAMGRLDEAKEDSESCLALRQKNLNANSPLLAECYWLESQIALDREQIDDAIAAIEKTIEIQKHVFPKGSRPLVSSLTNLGYLYYQKGNLSRAAELLRDSLAASENIPGQDPAETASGYIMLSDVYYSSRKDGLALAAIEKAIAGFRSRPGVRPVNLAKALLRKGGYLDPQDPEGAIIAYSEAAQLFTKTVGPKDSETIDSRASWAHCLMLDGRFKDALPILEDVAKTIQDATGIHPRKKHAIRVNLGTVYKKLKRFDEAEKSFLSSLEIASMIDEPAVALSKKALLSLYELIGEEEKAKRYR